ncbi:MAG: hypothetical protein NTY64_02520, partial [Deltaproteobacteria bacterium]|nr:hypothetical protein [Deltaproteobacteria bacterium]
MRCILRRCGVPPSTSHSGGFARLASGAFYFAIQNLTFYEFINFTKNIRVFPPNCQQKNGFKGRRKKLRIFLFALPQPPWILEPLV